jgi:hypothetical protein
MADGYRTPIDTFIEKAGLSKPPAPRIAAAPKQVVKNTTAAVPKVPVLPITSTADPRLSINAATSGDIVPAAVHPVSSTIHKTHAKPKAAASKKKVHHDSAAETMGNGVEQNGNDAPNGVGTETHINKKKRQRPPKQTSESPESKQKKLPQVISTPPDENNLEKAKILLSLIKENRGVFELVPRLDLLYASHVARFFPTAQPYVDGKILVSVLDDLEKRGEIHQIMLSAETSTGTKQYKSILILPEIDPVTNPKILAIREELNRELALYTSRPIATNVFGGQTLVLPITSLDAVRALYQSTSDARVSTFDSQTTMVEANPDLDKGEPDIPPTPSTSGSVEPPEIPERMDKKKRKRKKVVTGTFFKRGYI